MKRLEDLDDLSVYEIWISELESKSDSTYRQYTRGIRDFCEWLETTPEKLYQTRLQPLNLLALRHRPDRLKPRWRK